MHFWDKKGEKRTVDTEAMQAMANYSWPGNIRELENLVERLSVCTISDTITYADLPPPIGTAGMNNVEPIFNAIPSVWNTPQPQAPVIVDAAVNVSGNTPGAPLPPVAEEDTQALAPSIPPTPVAQKPSTVNEPSHDEVAANILASAFAPNAPIHETPPVATKVTTESFVASFELPTNVPSLLAEVEGAFIEKALEQTQGNKKAASELLGLQRTTLVKKLRRREKANENS
jgi:sigma-54 specific flagellar transcriptional regulator A